MKKLILIYFSIIFLALGYFKPLFAQSESDPLTIDPVKYCTVTVDEVVDGKVLNPYIKTNIFKLDNSGEHLINGNLAFNFDLSNIPKEYWSKNLSDHNGNGIPDELESGWITFDLEEANEDNPFSGCWKYLSDISGLSINTHNMQITSPLNGSCFFNNIATPNNSSPFTVALRFKYGPKDYRSICQQQITVTEKTYDEAHQIAEPSVVVEASSINGTYDQYDIWKITLRDGNIDSSFIYLLSGIEFVISSSPIPEDSSALYVDKNAQKIVGSGYVLDSGDLGNYGIYATAAGIYGFLKRTNEGDHFNFSLHNLNPGNYYVSVLLGYGTSYRRLGYTKIEVIPQGAPTPTPTPIKKPVSKNCQDALKENNGKLNAQLCAGVCKGELECTNFSVPENLGNICDSLKPEDQSVCKSCLTGQVQGGVEPKYPGQPGAYTAFGCLPTDLSSFFKQYLFVAGLGFAGTIAFLLILWGGFTIVISQGDPAKIQQGREIIISAIAGLLFIIFAVIILRIIGKDILKLPFIN